MTTRWRQRALEDIDDYVALIREYSLRAADDWTTAVRAKLEKAGRMPRIGRIVPEFEQEELRELFLHSHRLIYRISGESIEVLRVWHGARLLHKADLGEEE